LNPHISKTKAFACLLNVGDVVLVLGKILRRNSVISATSKGHETEDSSHTWPMIMVFVVLSPDSPFGCKIAAGGDVHRHNRERARRDRSAEREAHKCEETKGGRSAHDDEIRGMSGWIRRLGRARFYSRENNAKTQRWWRLQWAMRGGERALDSRCDSSGRHWSPRE
jgi:hypothetical protein